MTNVYRFAGLTIRVTSLYEEVHRLCTEYLVPDHTVDFAVRTTAADIDFERENSAAKDAAEGIPLRRFSDPYLETLAVYRKIAERIPAYDTFLFHGSAVAVDGAAYLFTAKSGTGKSTHTRLWREFLGERAVMVNDDKPLIRVTDGKSIIYGTPWDGKHHLSRNVAVPLKAICILERAEENHIEQVTRSEVLPMLIQQAYRPSDPISLANTLTLIERLNVGFYRLSCNMDISAAELSYHTMKE